MLVKPGSRGITHRRPSARGHADAEPAARLTPRAADAALGLFQVADDLLGALIELDPLRGRAHPPRRAVVKALNDPDVKAHYAKLAMSPAPSTSPAAYDKFVRSEGKRWGKVVKAAHITAK